MVVHNLATALSEKGHKVIVFVPYFKRREINKNCNYIVVQFGFRGCRKLMLFVPSMLVMLTYVVWRYRIEVINIHGIYTAGTWAYIYSKLFPKTPIVGTPHGDDLQVFPEINYGIRLDPKKDKIIKRNVVAFKWFTAISKSIRKNLEEILIENQRIVDIPNGVWRKIFIHKNERLKTRENLKVPIDSILLISIGRNHPKKGFECAVGALSQLCKENFNIYYLVVGREMDSIRKKADTYGVSERLLTPGQLEVEELAKLLQASDIYISPSLIESFGITTIEAMTAGLPCVVTEIEGSRDIVNTEFGIFTPPGDVKRLAEAVQYLIDNKNVMKKMGEKSYFHSFKYDWEIIAEKYEEIYQRAIMEK
jgi:glycosyltransferase involved in cell wall biosynthesis